MNSKECHDLLERLGAKFCQCGAVEYAFDLCLKHFISQCLYPKPMKTMKHVIVNDQHARRT